MVWSYSDYYQRNRDKLNKRRRERYKTDPEYRNRAQESSKEAKRKRPDGDTGAITRDMGGHTYTVVRIGDVAQTLGRSISVIRAWEIEGTIPPPSFPGAQRVYTPYQVKLLEQLSDAITSAGASKKASAQVKRDMAAFINHHWKDSLYGSKGE